MPSLRKQAEHVVVIVENKSARWLDEVLLTSVEDLVKAIELIPGDQLMEAAELMKYWE